MSKDIGTIAGKVWSTLHTNNGMMTVNQIKFETHLTDFDLFTAVGWLARENKIECLDDVLALKE